MALPDGTLVGAEGRGADVRFLPCAVELEFPVGDTALDGPASADGATVLAGETRLVRGEAGAEDRSESESDMLSPAESGMCGKASTCRSEGLIVGYDVLASSAIGNGGGRGPNMQCRGGGPTRRMRRSVVRSRELGALLRCLELRLKGAWPE